MATTTPHYGFTKPGALDYVDISVINANYDNIDTAIYNNQVRSQNALDDIAPEYNATATYAIGDYCTYTGVLYKCTTAVTTAEAFDNTKWTAVKVGGELKSHDTRITALEQGGGGGGINYSTTEQIIGSWVDGKPLYQKTLNLGNLPSSTSGGDYPHGISNLDTVISITGGARNDTGSNTVYIDLPYIDPSGVEKAISFYILGANVHVMNGMNRGDWTAYLTIQYTKTTDTANS